MKLFYTKKEVDEEIAKALYEEDRRRGMASDMRDMHRDIMQLRERLDRLEYKVASAERQATNTPINTHLTCGCTMEGE